MTLRPGPTPLLFAGFWLFFLVAGQSKLLRDPGTFWHTRVGERILTVGFFEQDPYTFTRGGEYWIPHQWLGEVAMALVHRIGGFDAFVMLTSAILAALFTWLTLRLSRTGLHFAVVAVAIGCALAAAANHMHVRPMLMTTIALAITTVLLVDFDAGQIGAKRLLWLVPLFAVWANLHGGMLGGLASIGFAIAGWTVWKLAGWPTPLTTLRMLPALVGLFVVCGLTMFVNPYGWKIPNAWLTIMQMPRIHELIEEHQPLDPTKPASWAVLLFAAFYLFVLAGTRKPRFTWLLPLFWLQQASVHVRHAPLFAVTACLAIAAMWPATRWAEWLAKRRPDLYDPQKLPPRRSPLDWLIPALLVGVSLILQATGTVVPVIGAGWARFDRELWPDEILETIRVHEPQPGQPNRIFNDCHLGGHLMFHAPGYRTFIDDRAELFGEDFLEEYIRGNMADTDLAIRRWEQKYQPFDFALVRPGNNYDKYFQAQGWRKLDECPAAVFYKR